MKVKNGSIVEITSPNSQYKGRLGFIYNIFESGRIGVMLVGGIKLHYTQVGVKAFVNKSTPRAIVTPRYDAIVHARDHYNFPEASREANIGVVYYYGEEEEANDRMNFISDEELRQYEKEKQQRQRQEGSFLSSDSKESRELRAFLGEVATILTALDKKVANIGGAMEILTDRVSRLESVTEEVRSVSMSGGSDALNSTISDHP